MIAKKYLRYILVIFFTSVLLISCHDFSENHAQTLDTNTEEELSQIVQNNEITAQTGLANMLIASAKERANTQPQLAEQLSQQAQLILNGKINLGNPAYYNFTAVNQQQKEVAFYAVGTSKIAYLFIGENIEKEIPQTISIDSLYYPQQNHSFVKPALISRSFWQASFTPENREKFQETFINSQQAKLTAIPEINKSGNQQTLHLKWSNVEVKDSPTLANVEVELRLYRDSEKSDWYINVNPKNNQEGQHKVLYNVEFPIIANVGKDTQLERINNPDYLVYPFHSGELIINPGNNLKPQEMIYPGEVRWQSLVYYHNNHGINFMVTDADGNVKSAVAKPTEGNTIKLSWLHHPAGMGYKNSRFRMMGDNQTVNYSCQISTFEGEWYEAAQVYREWMLQQNFLNGGRPKKLAENTQVADWAKNIIVSYRTYSDLGIKGENGLGAENNQVRQVYNFHRENLPEYQGQVSIYAWRDIEPSKGSYYDRPEVAPGDKNYIGKDFGKAIATLREANLHGNPFIESPLWDINGTTYKPQKGHQIALLQYNGKPIRVKFGKGEKERILGWVDVGEELWVTKQEKIMETLLQQAESEAEKIDGVYYDLALITNHLNHRNPKTVGGNHSALGWQKLVQRVTAKTRSGSGSKSNPEYTLFTEGMSDCYLNLNHFYLNFQATIPFDLVLWGDYVKTYGTKSSWEVTNNSNSTNWQQATPLALTLAWGQPIGRIDTNLINSNQVARDFIINLAKYRQANLDYLSTGRMLKPVSINSINWSSQPSPPVPRNQLADVMIPNGVFAHKNENNRDRLFIFVNGTVEKSIATIDFTIDAAQYNIPPNYKLYRRQLSLDGSETMSDIPVGSFNSGTITQSLQLQPLEIATYVAKP